MRVFNAFCRHLACLFLAQVVLVFSTIILGTLFDLLFDESALLNGISFIGGLAFAVFAYIKINSLLKNYLTQAQNTHTDEKESDEPQHTPVRQLTNSP